MNPTSLPVRPQQPAQPFYAISVLALFHTYTRETYLAAFGVQAPDFDPQRRVKSWFDSSVDPSLTPSATYTAFDQHSGNMTLITLPSAEAASVNLPGHRTYDAYLPPASTTRQVLTNGGSLELPVDDLCTPEEAQMIAADFGISFAAMREDHGDPLSGSIVYDPKDPRRVYRVDYKGLSNLIAAVFVREKYAAGVGSPGHWDFSGEEPRWIATKQATDQAAGDPIPVPCRPLLGNEKLEQSTLPGAYQIRRTDMGPAPSAGASNAAGGGFTDDDRALLHGIDAKLSKLIAAELGIQS
jgi:hypothetical protein